MNGWPELDRFLQTDPCDVGCAEAIDVRHVYVDLVASGTPAEQDTVTVMTTGADRLASRTGTGPR